MKEIVINAPQQMDGSARMAKGAVLGGAGIMVQQAVSLVSGVIVGRYLGAIEYGLLNIARNLLLVTAIFARFGLDLGLQRHLGAAGGSYSNARSTTIARSLLLTFTASLGVLIMLWFGGSELLEQRVYKHDGISKILVATFVALPFLCMLQVLGGSYRGRFNLFPPVFAEAVFQPVLRLCLVLAVIVFSSGVMGVVWVTTISYVLAWALLAFKAWRDFNLGPALRDGGDWHEMRALLRVSVVLALSVATSTLIRSVDVLALGYFSAAAEVGRYSVSQLASNLLGLVSTSFGQLMGPVISQLHQQGERLAVERVARDNVRFIAVTVAPLAWGFALFGADLLRLFGSDFGGAYGLVVVMALSQSVFALFSNSGYLLSMTGGHNVELKVLVAGLVCTFAFLVALVPPFGAPGAALATLVGTIITQGLRVWLVNRRLRVRIIEREAFRPLILGGVAMAPVAGAYYLMDLNGGWPGALLAGMAGVIMYSGPAFRFCLSVEERTQLAQKGRSIIDSILRVCR